MFHKINVQIMYKKILANSSSEQPLRLNYMCVQE